MRSTPVWAAAFGHLQQNPARGYVTEPLAARLFGHGRRSLCEAGCPLTGWGLVTTGEAPAGEPAPLSVDPIVIAWLQGELRMDPQLMGLGQVVEPRPRPFRLAGGQPRPARSSAWSSAARRARVLLVGPPASGRRTFAAAVAKQFGIMTLAIDTSEIAETDWSDTFMRAQRLAVLGNSALVWHGSQLHRIWPGHVAPAPIQFVAADVDQIVPPCEHLIDQRIEMPSPTLDERRGIWRAAHSRVRRVAGAGAGEARDPLPAERGRYRRGGAPGAGRAPAKRPISPASSRGSGSASSASCSTARSPGTTSWCRTGCARRSRTSPSRRATGSGSGRRRARDACSRAAPAWWRCSAARPGTGKTMAAQVIAADLEMDLFRIDLASVVSKYIGETAKHLRQIFARAARMNAVLLFDEADALFSKRTEVNDAHDRYANADTSYLLQLLEDYRGIVILATNKKQNIDPAFIRRVRYVFDFPRPDVAERRRIWRQVIGELCGHETLQRLEATIDALGTNVDLSGAQIKGAVLASIFAARRRARGRLRCRTCSRASSASSPRRAARWAPASRKDCGAMAEVCNLPAMKRQDG